MLHYFKTNEKVNNEININILTEILLMHKIF